MQRMVIDQLGRAVEVCRSPKRIVSLVPSQTELLFDLGLEKEVIGVTKFCIHPKDKVRHISKIGGTKKLNIDKIRSLKPDLIIGNKEENQQEQIEMLMREFPVWISDIHTLDDAKDAINKIGGMVDRKPEAEYLNHLIQTGFKDLQTLAVQKKIHKKVAYVIWKSPYMFAGKHTFIDSILEIVGLENVVLESRYPILELNDVLSQKPDLILLSSEPFPFTEKHQKQIQALSVNAPVILVDGEMFSWYGSRLVKAIQYLFQFQDRLR